ncbi:MAG: glutaminyl-peptide cyclotransferase [Alphaproteobacteria bacterium]|nr:glutaminyl-peptide cyclotransferase [Alphaproteobacteria bacterium]
MKNRSRRAGAALHAALLATLGAASPTASAATSEAGAAAGTAEASAITFYDYEIVNVFPHDADAFTQGLLVADGDFYESTGLRGRSSIRRVDIETGAVRRSQALPDRYFGEGLALAGDRFVALTYTSGLGFVLSRDDFRKLGQFAYDGEGWGLTFDGNHLVMSDGSADLEFRDPETFEVVRSVTVTFRGKPLRYLNELEYVDGRILANVYGADEIVRINPKTGVVDGVILLSGIIAPEERGEEPGGAPPVLNGIAYDPEADRLFVTGKLWPKVFEIRLKERAN